MCISLSLNDYIIRALPDDDAPTRKCRAVICDVYTEETDSEVGLGNVEIAFLLLSPSFEEPYIYEKRFINWYLNGDIAAAFECLVDDSLASSFYDLIGTVFDAKIIYHAYKNKIHAELELQKMILSPPTANN